MPERQKPAKPERHLRLVHSLHMPHDLHVPPRLSRGFRRVPRWVWIVLLVLIVLRLAASWIALRAVNWGLEHKLSAYTGHVNGLRIHLYRGAYDIRGLAIRKRGASGPPLLAADRIDLSLSWKRLVHREISAKVWINHAVVNFVSGPKEQAQYVTEEPAQNWRATLKTIIPADIQDLHIQGSEVHYLDANLRSPLAVNLRDLRFDATGLRDREDKAQPYSFFDGSARLQDQARVAFGGQVDALAARPRGLVRFELLNFDLSTINKLLLTYVPLNIYRGRMSLYSETAFLGKRAKGYVKVFFDNLKVMAPKEKFKNTKHAFFEMGTAFANWLLKNVKHDSLASFIPFDYHGQKFDAKTSEAFWTAIKNKFAHLPRGFEHTVTMATVEENKKILEPK